MPDVFDPETSEIVEKINAHEITGQSDVSDLKKALLITVAACRDYGHYASALGELIEDFDESLEFLAPTSWFNSGSKRELGITTQCQVSLRFATQYFETLAKQAEENCAMTVKAILCAPPAAQAAVLGRVYSIPAQKMDARIEGLFEALTEVEYHKSMPENLDAFLALMDEEWGEKA